MEGKIEKEQQSEIERKKEKTDEEVWRGKKDEKDGLNEEK